MLPEKLPRGIAATSFQTGVPVVFGVLTTDSMQQALERAGIKSNLGWNYAMSALEMASLMPQVLSGEAAAANNGIVGSHAAALPVSVE